MRGLAPCFGLLLVAASGLAAQAPAADSAALRAPIIKGFFLGFDGAGASLQSDYITGSGSKGGGGFGLRFGWGLSESVTLAMDVAATRLAVADTADYYMGHGDVLLRYHPLRWSRGRVVWVPFVHAGAGFRDVTAEDVSPTNSRIYGFEGGVFTFGGGTYVFLDPRASLFAALYHSRGDFDDERIGNVTTHSRNEPGVSTRLVLGINWHMGRGEP